MSDLLIKNGRVIDPANVVDKVMDILVQKGKISRVEKKIDVQDVKVIDAKDKWVTPGLVDIHVHFREPGYEYKETIETGALSAAAGGFTTVACMANTSPVNDNGSVTEYILDKASRACVNVHPIGAVTRGLEGKALAEIGEMAKLGIVALSDDGECVMDGGIMRSAMEYASMFNLTIMEHAEDTCLAQGGSMNEGAISSSMGLIGQPCVAEENIVARDIALSEYLDLPIHFCHISSAGSCEMIRNAKDRGVKVTAEAAPHHFTLTDKECVGYNTNAKMAPPLRRDQDVTVIRESLANGVIDCIATDHAPHSRVEKEVEFENAAFGITGLETGLALSLMMAEDINMSPVRLIESMSAKPAEIIGVNRGAIGVGDVADITLIDPAAEWTVDPAEFKSKGKNTPYGGMTLKGRAAMTIVKGKVVYKWEQS